MLSLKQIKKKISKFFNYKLNKKKKKKKKKKHKYILKDRL